MLGSGIAGLSTALKLARQTADAAGGATCEITLVAKADLAEGATRYAQGGIASVWSSSDTFADHERDTVEAGAGLCRLSAVELCVREGPARVRELVEQGVAFTQRPGEGGGNHDFDLHLEGGHSQRRILHADDLTGWAIEKALIDRLRALERAGRVRVLENHVAIDLITEGKVRGRRAGGRCLGAYVLSTATGKVLALDADVTILATGGAGKVYLYTTNPDVATGDGVAMAHRAGARVGNLEFIQFHPTCLFHASAKNFLISEAVRGEGAVLRTVRGDAFMKRYHPMGDLAPRDVVARAIDIEMKRSGDRHVWLDASHLGADRLRAKFPNIHEACLRFGLDLTREPLPVVPAAHYSCGGVMVDEYGATSLEGLYAVGEVACTGLHGANRLASNSLLEAVVYADRAARHALSRVAARESATPEATRVPEWDTGRAVELEERIDIAATWLEVRTLMWNYVGIVRSNRRLERARRRLENLDLEVTSYYWDYLPTRDLIELRNLITVAKLVVACALSRKESRGLHFTTDYPERDEANFGRDTVV